MTGPKDKAPPQIDKDSDAEKAPRCTSTYFGSRCELDLGHAGQHVARATWMVRRWD